MSCPLRFLVIKKKEKKKREYHVVSMLRNLCCNTNTLLTGNLCYQKLGKLLPTSQPNKLSFSRQLINNDNNKAQYTSAIKNSIL